MAGKSKPGGMRIHISAHAVKRFRERVEDLPKKLLRRVVERMLAESVDFRSKHFGRFSINKPCWLHPTTGVVFVLNLDRANIIGVVTVMRLKKE